MARRPSGPAWRWTQSERDAEFDRHLLKALQGAGWVCGAMVDIRAKIKRGDPLPSDFERFLQHMEHETSDAIAQLRDASGYTRGSKEI